MTDLFFTQPFLVAATGVSATKFIMILAVIFSIFVLPFLLGNFIARTLKLKDLAGRISLVLCVTFGGLAPFIWPFVNYQFQITEYETQKVTYEERKEKYEKDLKVYVKEKKVYDASLQVGKKPLKPEEVKELIEPAKPTLDNIIRKGIDLAGGTNLLFQVQFDKLDKKIENKSGAMDQMIGAIIRRINPSGTEEVVVRKVGEDRIEVIIPGADQAIVQQKKRLMTRLGSLEFGILATRLYRDHLPIIEKALRSTEPTIRKGEQIVAKWHDVAIDRKKKEIKFTGADAGSQLISREKKGPDGKTLRDSAGNIVRQYLVIYAKDNERVTGKYLTRAGSTNDQSGNPAVSFNFDSEGAYRFRNLTTKYKPLGGDKTMYHLAVLLDGEIHSAPTINEPIGASGQISGRFTRASVRELVNVLNAGALEVPIDPKPVQEMTISPMLGADVIQKGMFAIMFAGGAVLIFMIAYYWFAGFVADLCLILNIILVMGAMVMINAAFTLPGLAGIVLTIGMAVDANVLIFERIREEINRGSSTRMAIQNGFDRAFTTIVDANVTTLLTAIVLYMIGTDQVRGFAVTLFIGIVMSMFTSLYFGRLIFDIVEQKRWLKKISMFSVIGKTSIDFISKRRLAAIVSLVLISGGLIALISRGSHMLDIDFTGGTMLTFEVEEPATSNEIKKILEAEFGTSITVEQLAIGGKETASEKGKHFRLRTTQRDRKTTLEDDGKKQDSVSHRVDTAFKKSDIKLLHTTLKYGKIINISQGSLSIDTPSAPNKFAGGQQVELEFNHPVNQSVVLETLSEEIEKIKSKETKNSKYQDVFLLLGAEDIESKKEATTNKNRHTKWQIKTKPLIAKADFQTALASMQKKMSESPTFEGVNSFDSAVASEMKQQAFMAMFASLIAIIGYIWFRFQRITFGLAAVVALVHDVLIVLGMVALANWLVGGVGVQFLKLEEFKINLPMIAAFLTIVGYSLNDTIVVFDRIREVRGKNPNITADMLNLSLNQTLSRTILTSLTTFVVVAILYFFGGEGIHGFAYCLVLGVIVGTYSSIYVASPVLLWLMTRAEKTKEATT